MQPAETCIYYPVKSYVLVLKSPLAAGQAINFALDCNLTEIFLNRLEDNNYIYSITAINTIGNATTGSEKVLCEFNS